MKGVIFALFLVMGIGQSIEISAADTQGDLTVLGITLGRSLNSVGIRECRHLKIEGLKPYDLKDTECYRHKVSGSSCSTFISKQLSFRMSILVFSVNDCNLQSPVEKIQAEFNSEDFEKVSSLVVGKFGEPHKTENSVVQTRAGAKYNKIENIWKINGNSIYLTNMFNNTDEGALLITHSDRIKKEAAKSQKSRMSDQEKF